MNFDGGIELVSVIIPVYNIEKYIERCVDSVKNQTFKDLEIILVDDGSKDSSGLICDNLAKTDIRINVIHQKNMGPSEARNAGLRVAKGEYIGFIDGDDWIQQDFYEHLFHIARREDADVVSCLYKKAYSQSRKDSLELNEKITVLEGDSILEKFLASAIKGGVTHVSCCSKIYRRELIVGYFFEKGITYSEDLIFNWEVLNKAKKYVYTNYVGYFYYDNRNSITKKKFSKTVLDLYYVAERIDNLYQSNHKKIKLLLKQYRIKVDFSILIKLIISHHQDKQFSVKIIREVKKGYKYLIRSPLSFSRKIVLTMVKVTPQTIILKIISS